MSAKFLRLKCAPSSPKGRFYFEPSAFSERLRTQKKKRRPVRLNFHEGSDCMSDYPILEFDTAAEAVIEPSRVYKPVAGLPERCVVCFFQEVISTVCANATVIAHLGSE